MTAAYAEGIARNHPFVGGNKRTAYATPDFFLYQKEWDFGIKDAQTQIRFFENFAPGNVSLDAMTTFYRRNSRERSSND